MNNTQEYQDTVSENFVIDARDDQSFTQSLDVISDKLAARKKLESVKITFQNWNPDNEWETNRCFEKYKKGHQQISKLYNILSKNYFLRELQILIFDGRSTVTYNASWNKFQTDQVRNLALRTFLDQYPIEHNEHVGYLDLNWGTFHRNPNMKTWPDFVAIIARNRFIAYQNCLPENTDTEDNPLQRAMSEFIDNARSHLANDGAIVYPCIEQTITGHSDMIPIRLSMFSKMEMMGFKALLEHLAQGGPQKFKGIDELDCSYLQLSRDAVNVLIDYFTDLDRPLPFKKLTLTVTYKHSLARGLTDQNRSASDEDTKPLIEKLPQTNIETLTLPAPKNDHKFNALLQIVARNGTTTRIVLENFWNSSVQSDTLANWQAVLYQTIYRNQRAQNSRRILERFSLEALLPDPNHPSQIPQLILAQKKQPSVQPTRKIGSENNLPGEKIRRCKLTLKRRQLPINFQVQQQVGQQVQRNVEQVIEQQQDVNMLLEQRQQRSPGEVMGANESIHNLIYDRFQFCTESIQDHLSDAIHKNKKHRDLRDSHKVEYHANLYKISEEDYVRDHVFYQGFKTNQERAIVWDSLGLFTGEKSKPGKIARVSQEAAKIILKVRDNFLFGLDFDNLPAGFYTHEIDGQQTLCFSHNRSYTVQQPDTMLLDHIPTNRDDAAVSVKIKGDTIKRPDSAHPVQSETQKFFDFISAHDEAISTKIKKSYENSVFTNLTPDDLSSLKQVFYKSGGVGVALVCKLFDQIARAHPQYFKQFNAHFIDPYNDGFLEFLSDDAIRCFNQLARLNSNQLHWWEELTKQHREATGRGKFVTLFKHYHYFLTKLQALNIELPDHCGIKGIRNFQIALNRLLYILNNSIYRQEQMEALNDGMSLEYMDGYFAARYKSYYFIHPLMQLHASGTRDEIWGFPTDAGDDYNVELSNIANPTDFYRYIGQQMYCKKFSFYTTLPTYFNNKRANPHSYQKFLQLLAELTTGERAYKVLPQKLEPYLNILAKSKLLEKNFADLKSLLDVQPKLACHEFATIVQQLELEVENLSSQTLRYKLAEIKSAVEYFNEYFLAAVLTRDKTFNHVMTLEHYVNLLTELSKNNKLPKADLEKLGFIISRFSKQLSVKKCREMCELLANLEAIKRNETLTLLASLMPASHNGTNSLDVDSVFDHLRAVSHHEITLDQLNDHFSQIRGIIIADNPNSSLFSLINMDELLLQHQGKLPKHDLEHLIKLLKRYYPSTELHKYSSIIDALSKIHGALSDQIHLLLSAIASVTPGISNFTPEQFARLLSTLGGYYKDQGIVAPKILIGCLLNQRLQPVNEERFRKFLNEFNQLLSASQFTECQKVLATNVLLLGNVKSDIDLHSFIKFLGGTPPLIEPALRIIKQLLMGSQNFNLAVQFISSTAQLQNVDQLLLSNFISRFADNPDVLCSCLQDIANLSTDKQQNVIFILSELRVLNELTIKLFENADTSHIDRIKQLFESKPQPNMDSLKQLINAEHNQLSSLIASFEKAPFGERDLNKQFNTDHLVRAIVNLNDPSTEEYLTLDEQQELLDDCRFVNFLGNQYKDLSLEALKNNFKHYCGQLKSNPNQDKIKLAILATAREVLYRTNNLFANSTQVVALIHQLKTREHVLTEMATGEGKSLVSAISALYAWVETGYVDVATSSMSLAQRDCENFKHFFNFFDITSRVIADDSALDSYELPGIFYSDVGNLALFRSRCRFEGGHIPDEKSLILDEGDHTFYDDLTRYNFATTLSTDEDAHYNSFAWVYPLINAFIDSNVFTNTNTSIDDDINNAFAFLHEKAHPQQQKQLEELVTYQQMDTWLESAVAAKQLRDQLDYVIKNESRAIKGHEIPIEFARILISGRHNPKAQWSYGVHQFLHARLNSRNTDANAPSFPIDPEHTFVDSTTNKDFLLSYATGRIVALTGTAGAKMELAEAKQKYGVKIRKIPKHNPDRRVDLATQFTFDRQQQFESIIAQVERRRKLGQPILIIAQDIEESEALHQALLASDIAEEQLQLVNAQVGNERLAVARAGKSGMVTVSTDLMGRGVDIIPEQGTTLCVINTHLSDTRLDRQGRGRTDRQGNGGETITILNSQSLDNLPGNKYQGKQKHYYSTEGLSSRIRHDRCKILQKRRFVHEKLGDIRAEFSNEFYQMLPHIRNSSDQNWLSVLQKWSHFLVDLDNKWHILFEETASEQELYAAPIESLEQTLTEFQRYANTKWNSLKSDLNKQLPQLNNIKPQPINRNTFTIATEEVVKHPIGTYDHYDDAQDGRPTVYSGFFTHLFAVLTGKRKLFANTRAALQGRGIFFANTRSVLFGDRPFLSDLRAIMNRFFQWCKSLFATDRTKALEPSMKIDRTEQYQQWSVELAKEIINSKGKEEASNSSTRFLSVNIQLQKQQMISGVDRKAEIVPNSSDTESSDEQAERKSRQQMIKDAERKAKKGELRLPMPAGAQDHTSISVCANPADFKL